ncbi:probable sodium/potassium/calcium exchanger CG1090 [Bombus huntii]|uniref:probable sodium/potassium/calcium exchanger CG1090 n=1 Tax=Bombus huntii TaxID=85661 RepID=UPI0021AADB39|nr:probable sodium/potassium/calcium exchanger CG1090 [Bombus huntii]XP_050491409.1 probable sodium/potassium/calcium exchanger CG1090 [Bombus huntii]
MCNVSEKGSKTMRRIHLESISRRRRWSLRFGLFLVYILVQYVTCAKIPEEVTSPYPSSTDREENWTLDSTSESFTPETEASVEPKPKAKEEAVSEKEKNERTEPKNEKNRTEEKNEGQQKHGKKTPEEEKSKLGEHSKERNAASTEKASPAEKTVPKKEVATANVPGTTTVPTTTTMKYEHATWRPRRKDCSPPAIEQFPRPLMGPSARKHGGLIIHILVAIYTFLGLAIVCDDYFVSSLDRICEELRLSPDVAGATFMAAGSSAPELATVVIGVFFAKDDIGVSGVIGSAVFNIMFVISVCGLCTSTVSKLNWWPLCRDCFFYAVSILVMLGTIYNESISWMESLFMLFMYGVYCVALSYNARLERWAKSYNIPFLPKDDEPAEESALVSYRSLQEDRLSYTGPSSPTDQYKEQEGVTAGAVAGGNVPETNESAPPKQPSYYKAKEPDPNEVSPLEKPTDGSKWSLFTWGLVYPIHFMCRATMPDCRQDKFRNWYPFTFCVSMVWISFYSYFMVWMITIIGSTLGIPDTVMGLTFVAAGVSVPDALSSLAVIKEGLGDMAVSNAVGSNVFDILVCLGLPWFIQTAMIQPGSHVNVTSRGLTYSTVSLLSTVVFLVLATHLNGWKLDRRYGAILMVWYLVFITFASLYELNVFGEMNPPVCFSAF